MPPNRRANQVPPVPVVAVINMKGGVGKTTLAANVFREVFRCKQVRTLVIDFDPQFNLSQLLLTGDQYDTLKEGGKTILHVLDPPAPDSVFSTSATAGSQAVELVVDDYTRRLKYLRGDEDVQFRLLPGDFGLARFNLREDLRSLQAPRERFANLVLGAKESYGLVVIDCNPSSSFLTRCALEAASHLVIPVRPDRFSVLGVQMILDYVEELQSLPRGIPYSIVLNDIVRNEVTAIENQLRANRTFGGHVLVNRIPRSTLLHARSDYSGFATDRGVAWSSTLRRRLVAVADELARRLEVR